MGSCRAIHNQLVEKFNKNELPSGKRTNFIWLRNRFVIASKNNISKKMQWTLQTPKHIREAVVKEFATNIKTRLNARERFQMHFRSKKKGESTILIPKASIKNIDHEQLKIYPKVLQRAFVETKQTIDIQHDCRLQMDHLGRFYLLIPVKSNVVAIENQGGKVAFLDPGVRTFQTIYSPTPGVAYKVCDREMRRLHTLQLQIDTLNAIRSSAVERSRKLRLQRALRRAWYRLQHCVDDLHYKTAHFLCSNFETIIVPPFETSNMVRRGNRRIGRTTVRDMTCLSHYKFRQRLLHIAKQRSCRVFVMGEEYTSKTCSHCGQIQDVGGMESVTCNACGVTMDRDVRGARNIGLKNLHLVCHATALECNSMINTG